MKQINKNIKLLLTAIVLSMMLVVSCNKNNSQPQTSDNLPFDFLKVENEGVYGVYDNESDTLLYTRTLIVLSENDNVYTLSMDENNIIEHFINDEGWFVDGFLELPKNAYVGQQGNDQFGSKEVVSISETVIVPAGTFSNCIKTKEIHPHGSDIYTYRHYSYGLIMVEFVDEALMKLISTNF